MTIPPEDQPPIWLKQVPEDRPDDDGVWSQRLLPGHRAVARARALPPDVDPARVVA